MWLTSTFYWVLLPILQIWILWEDQDNWLCLIPCNKLYAIHFTFKSYKFLWKKILSKNRLAKSLHLQELIGVLDLLCPAQDIPCTLFENQLLPCYCWNRIPDPWRPVDSPGQDTMLVRLKDVTRTPKSSLVKWKWYIQEPNWCGSWSTSALIHKWQVSTSLHDVKLLSKCRSWFRAPPKWGEFG